ncbi:MAG: hypothetical protein NC453_17630 [Muribaculum sp.]|nr:hypothetical protein [Muribaculum sp.]
MVKLFRNVHPLRLNEEIDKEMLSVSLKAGVIKVPEGYLCECEQDNLVVQQAVSLSNYLEYHGVEIQVGLTCNPNEMYPGWILILDTKNHKGSVNAVVSKFFTWSSIENQYIMEFEELVQDSWD